MKQRIKVTPQRVVGAILFVSLALSIVYAFVHFLQAPDTAPEGMPHAKVKSDYLLMLTQCMHCIDRESCPVGYHGGYDCGCGRSSGCSDCRL